MSTFRKMLIADLTADGFELEPWSAIESTAANIVQVPRSSPQFAAELKDAEAVLLNVGTGLSAAEIESAPALRYIGILATGFGRIDLAAASARQIVVTNVPGYSTQSVAEIALAGSLLVARDLEGELARARAGDYGETDFNGREVAALRVGVVGAGAIGGRTAQLFRGLGAEVAYWSRARRPELEAGGIKYVTGLKDLAAQSDVLTIHLAANDGTEGLVDATVVATLRPGSIVINTAPNEVIDLRAVLDRCAAGELRYVFDHPDELEDQLLLDRIQSTPGVTVLPPIGYATKEATLRKQKIFVGNVEAFLQGAPQNNVA